MYYTANQAAERWCPMAQVPAGIGANPRGHDLPGVPYGPTINRCSDEALKRGRAYPGCAACLGPKCAAWRWAPGQGIDATGQVVQRRAIARDQHGAVLPPRVGRAAAPSVFQSPVVGVGRGRRPSR